MDLVDEEERPLPRLAARARLLEDLLQFRDAGMDRRYLLEFEVGLLGKKPGDRRLPRPRRPPEDERAERTRGEHPGQRAVRPDQGVLSDDLGKRLRPEAIGKRARAIAVETRRLEQALRTSRRPAAHVLTSSPDDDARHVAVAAELDAPEAAVRLRPGWRAAWRSLCPRPGRSARRRPCGSRRGWPATPARC